MDIVKQCWVICFLTGHRCLIIIFTHQLIQNQLYLTRNDALLINLRHHFTRCETNWISPYLCQLSIKELNVHIFSFLKSRPTKLNAKASYFSTWRHLLLIRKIMCLLQKWPLVHIYFQKVQTQELEILSTSHLRGRKTLG